MPDSARRNDNPRARLAAGVPANHGSGEPARETIEAARRTSVVYDRCTRATRLVLLGYCCVVLFHM
jgi:hypothetical protein